MQIYGAACGYRKPSGGGAIAALSDNYEDLWSRMQIYGAACGYRKPSGGGAIAALSDNYEDLWSRTQIYGAACGYRKPSGWGAIAAFHHRDSQPPFTLFRGQKLKTAETTKHSPPWLCQMWGRVTCGGFTHCQMRGYVTCGGFAYCTLCTNVRAHTEWKSLFSLLPSKGELTANTQRSLQQESQQER